MDTEIMIKKEKFKFKIVFMYLIIILLSAFLFNSPSEIIIGLKSIILAPGILLTDYILIANIGSSFFNSGLLMLLALGLVKINKANLSGPIIAGILTIGGFAFFGKSLYNVWAIIIGVYLYSLSQKDSFDKYLAVAFFGTALAPIISQVSFGFNIQPVLAIIIGNLLGIVAGFILHPLANHFISFHQGFNLYNTGFTAGIIAILFMSFFRLIGLNTSPNTLMSSGNDKVLGLYFMLYFLSMIIIGFYLNDKSLKGFKKLLSHSGKLSTDYVDLFGFGLSLLNIGSLGVMSVLYVILVKGDFNGPVIGALFTVAGFGSFGKHLKNTVFIIIGVNIAALISGVDLNLTTVIISALFGTALAPISGKYGWAFGIIAGIIHFSIVVNTAVLHGGMNLYNNGFAAGIVAAIMLPLIKIFKRSNTSN